MSTKRHAADVILLAAASFEGEFSEWDLTMAAWKIDPQRFGMRGHSQHPDHKRVSMEIMGNKTNSPIVRHWLVRTRPNHFKVTSLGRMIAAVLTDPEKCVRLYDTLAPYTTHPTFKTWLDRPDQPEDVADALAFLHAPADDAITRGQIRWLRAKAQEAMHHLRQNKTDALARQVGRGPSPIPFQDLSYLLDFLTALEARFFTPTTKARAV